MEAVLQGPSSRTVLGPTVLTIGRTTDNQLVVNDPKASSHHAEMRPSGQGYSIIDLGSTNGTFVNDQRLERNIPRPLATGDRVRIGDTLFTYIVTGVAPGAYGSPGQASYSEYTPTIAAPSAGSYEYTGYGQGGQQYPPPSAYPPSQPYESPQQQYAPPPPAYPPYAQPYAPPGVPVPPPYVPPPTPSPVAPISPPTAKKARGGSRVLLIVLAILVVLAAGGGFLVYHFLTLPPPVIQVTSKFQVGSIPAGSISTSFHVSAQKFPANSTITFLLDDMPIPGNVGAQSDANGNVQADLTVTSAWSVGNHTLTAKDANNDTTKLGAAVVIVPPGEAGTPGPNGAPPDNMKFSLNISIIQPKDVTTGKTLNSFTQTLVITGQPDPTGGTVCRQPFPQQLTSDGTLNNGAISYHETYVQTCSGTYKGGQLSYTETITSDQYALPGGVTCTVKVPYASERLTGSFTTSTAISGMYSSDKITAPCSNNTTTVTFDALSGSWTGQSS